MVSDDRACAEHREDAIYTLVLDSHLPVHRSPEKLEEDIFLTTWEIQLLSYYTEIMFVILTEERTVSFPGEGPENSRVC